MIAHIIGLTSVVEVKIADATLYNVHPCCLNLGHSSLSKFNFVYFYLMWGLKSFSREGYGALVIFHQFSRFQICRCPSTCSLFTAI